MSVCIKTATKLVQSPQYPKNKFTSMLHLNTFVFNPFSENTYLVYDDDKNCLIIDPGCMDATEQDAMSGFIESNGLNPVMLLNTHCHLDHIFGNQWVFKSYGLELHLHPLDEPVLDHAPASGLMFGLPIETYTGPRSWLKEGEEIALGEYRFQIMHLPGHSPGSVGFYESTQKFLISGDVLFQGSIGRTDLPGGNHATLLNSIREKLFVLPDDVTVYSGHGEPTTIGVEKATNPFFS
jgi:glyoxylase-like metal-dependent hydrolase (beta-lactamase superfamily II)